MDYSTSLPAAGLPDAPPRPRRIASLDAWRGFVMLLMMAEVLGLTRLKDIWNAPWAHHLAFHTDHVAWRGCSLHDMIQPAFSFLVGAAMVFSLARRKDEQSRGGMFLHALWRALVLVLLGVWLRSLHSERTQWTFEDTLTQIGLGYPFLFLLGLCRPVVQGLACVVILIGYWMAFALFTVPPDFNYAAVGVPPDWAQGVSADWIQSGFAAHWNMNANAAWAFDRWFLNLFPRKEPFLFNDGGYSTLSFIPTLATMILGLLAGSVLRSERTVAHRLLWFLGAGMGGIALGLVLDATGACPLVKRIWTPSWTLYSGGVCFLILAGFYLLADVWRLRGLFLPLIVLGMNSIAAYLIAHLWPDFIGRNLTIHLPHEWFHNPEDAAAWLKTRHWPDPRDALLHGSLVLLIEFVVLAWMYRLRIFLRI